MRFSRDLPERYCEKRITKPVETEQSDRHGRQRERIRDRRRPICCSSHLLLVPFVARPICCSVPFVAASHLLQRQGFVPRAQGLALNPKFLVFALPTSSGGERHSESSQQRLEQFRALV